MLPRIATPHGKRFGYTCSMIVSPARPNELDAALALALGHALDCEIVEELDPRGVFVAREGDVLRGAVCCQPTGGAAALVSGPRGDATDELIAAGLAWLQKRGVKIVHAMARPENAAVLTPLGRHGFAAVGPMEYLRLTLAGGPPCSPRDSSLTLRPFDETVFAKVLERTYLGSLDFPELMGVQTTAEILAGYRANPKARAENWFLAESNGENGAAAGVLMLTEVEPIEHWDLTYVGVVPERRRRGLGRALVRAAIDHVMERGGERLEVAVDARNGPARQLYRELGFQLIEHRLVSLKFLLPSPENDHTY